MREACLSGLRLLSDHQPDHLRVDDEASGLPHVWLHEENPTTASISQLSTLSTQFVAASRASGSNWYEAAPIEVHVAFWIL
jgi:hypothetical protein